MNFFILAKKMKNRFIIFDRDGTLVKLKPYLHKVEEVEFTNNLSKGLLELKKNGFKFGIITNQSGISRGLFNLGQMVDVNNYIQKKLLELKIKFEFIYYCPHKPEDNCICRKPKPYLGVQAIKNFIIDIETSYYVGDAQTDVNFAHAINLKSVLIGKELINSEIKVDIKCNDILDFVLKMENQ
jgi:D-glycero-D-manno-heptose 1,7-bisphosphate phosphatase